MVINLLKQRDALIERVTNVNTMIENVEKYLSELSEQRNDYLSDKDKVILKRCIMIFEKGVANKETTEELDNIKYCINQIDIDMTSSIEQKSKYRKTVDMVYKRLRKLNEQINDIQTTDDTVRWTRDSKSEDGDMRVMLITKRILDKESCTIESVKLTYTMEGDDTRWYIHESNSKQVVTFETQNILDNLWNE